MLVEFLMLAADGSSELMFPLTFLIVALGFVGLVILILIGKGRAD